MEVASSLGLTVSFVKMKFMMVGTTVSDEDKRPLAVGDYTKYTSWTMAIRKCAGSV